MFGENKNFEDPSTSIIGLTIKDRPINISYTKTNKLVTALYMVTDIIDKDEPLKNKLRTLGVGIVSDIQLIKSNSNGHIVSGAIQKISEILSFLEIASAVNIISEMNANILKKEFLELNQAILNIKSENELNDNFNKQINLSDFFENSLEEKPKLFSHFGHLPVKKDREMPKGQTRIGVQKGSTLMRALSDKTGAMSDIKSNHIKTDVFDALKKQRREEIITIIQKNNKNATITDIKNGAYDSLVSCGEKTLQRELVSMVKDGVLDKTGEKRWSRYFIK